MFCLIKKLLFTQQSFVSGALGNEQADKDTDKKKRSQRQGSEWRLGLGVRDVWIMQASHIPTPSQETPGNCGGA